MPCTLLQACTKGMPVLTWWMPIDVHAVSARVHMWAAPVSHVQARSDSMTPACDAVALPWLLRKAMLLISDLELLETPTHFETRLKAGGVLDVSECYPWTGQVR